MEPLFYAVGRPSNYDTELPELIAGGVLYRSIGNANELCAQLNERHQMYPGYEFRVYEVRIKEYSEDD